MLLPRVASEFWTSGASWGRLGRRAWGCHRANGSVDDPGHGRQSSLRVHGPTPRHRYGGAMNGWAGRGLSYIAGHVGLLSGTGTDSHSQERRIVAAMVQFTSSMADLGREPPPAPASPDATPKPDRPLPAEACQFRYAPGGTVGKEVSPSHERTRAPRPPFSLRT